MWWSRIIVRSIAVIILLRPIVVGALQINTVNYDNGDRYIGQHNQIGQRHGRGIYRWNTGEEYDGEWWEDRQHGIGKSKHKEGVCRYHGEWRYGREHGKGILNAVNGDVYDGEMRNGQIHGVGILKFANGVVYDGEHAHGKRNGIGFYRWPNGETYHGEWMDDQRNGVGTQTSAWKVYWYHGEWKDDRKHGKGTVAVFWAFLECQAEWDQEDLLVWPTCRFGLFQRWFGATWQFFVLYWTHFLRGMEILWHNFGKPNWSYFVRHFGKVHRFYFVKHFGKFNRFYFVKHYLEIGIVMAVWIGSWVFYRELADVKAKVSKLENDKDKLEANMKEIRQKLEENDQKKKHYVRVDDETLFVELDQDHIQCGVCYEFFTTDMKSTDKECREMLPVMGSCGHYFCHGCIIRWRKKDLRSMVVSNDGAIGCPKCMKANQFVPGNPTHHRMLIDLLQRARPVES